MPALMVQQTLALRIRLVNCPYPRIGVPVGQLVGFNNTPL